MHGVVCNTLYEIGHTLQVDYQNEEEVERETVCLVGGEVDVHE